MAIKSRYFCDECGKEVKSSDALNDIQSNRFRIDKKYLSIDICDQCYKKIFSKKKYGNN